MLFAKLGFRVAEVPVSHRERPDRQRSKHNFFKRLDQFMSVFMGVKTKPFQFVQILGVVAVGVSGLGFVIALARRAAQADGDLGLRVLVSIGLGLWGFLTVVTGTIGEYIVGMNHEIGRHPKYLVRKVHE